MPPVRPIGMPLVGPIGMPPVGPFEMLPVGTFGMPPVDRLEYHRLDRLECHRMDRLECHWLDRLECHQNSRQGTGNGKKLKKCLGVLCALWRNKVYKTQGLERISQFLFLIFTLTNNEKDLLMSYFYHYQFGLRFSRKNGHLGHMGSIGEITKGVYSTTHHW